VFKYEHPKQGRVEDDDDDDDEDEDDCDEDDNFVMDEARAYSSENVGPVDSPYLMPYVYKRRFFDTQNGVRKDRDMFI